MKLTIKIIYYASWLFLIVFFVMAIFCAFHFHKMFMELIWSVSMMVWSIIINRWSKMLLEWKRELEERE